jgi:hypothetical protein
MLLSIVFDRLIESDLDYVAMHKKTRDIVKMFVPEVRRGLKATLNGDVTSDNVLEELQS